MPSGVRGVQAALKVFAQRLRVAYAINGENRKTIAQETGICETYLSFSLL